MLSWRNEFIPEMRQEGFSRMTYELEQQGDSVKLTVLHEIDVPDSKFIGSVSTGWPMLLSSLEESAGDGRIPGTEPSLAERDLRSR